MRYLINSAIVPVGGDGQYVYRTVDQAEAVSWLKAGSFISLVGYQDTVDFIYSVSGVSVSLSRDSMNFVSGDEALVVRLKYRLSNPGDKGKFTPLPSDYDFSILRKA